MDITLTPTEHAIEVAIAGRLDGYWADHLDNALAETIRNGHHHVVVDLSRATFISSAGVGVLMKYYKQLSRINGSLAVSRPSRPVRLVLEMVHVSAMLIAPDDQAPGGAGHRLEGRVVDREGVRFETFDLAAGATLTCRAIGNATNFGARAVRDADVIALSCPDSLFALGVGAFGESLDDCRERFGELLAISGAAVYQPADGTNVPDYLVASGSHAPRPRVLHALACEGPLAVLTRFDAGAGGGSIGLTDLARSCLDIAGGDAAGVAIVAEAVGLVGAALRQSPVRPASDGDFFAHPSIRNRLTFTAERSFAHTLALVAGVVARADVAAGHPQLRPLGGELAGHFHAAAFPFRPFKKGLVPLKETVTSLFESESVLGVLHLLNDDREALGAGESAFIRGARWIGPIGAWTSEPVEET